MKSALVLIALMLMAASATAQKPARYEGRPLTEALKALQAQGLRIVFSSATVPGDLEVAAEPRATTPREQLDELLAPHGLDVKDGPGGTLQVVRGRQPHKKSRPPTDRPARRKAHDASTASPLGHIFVRVVGHSSAHRQDPGVASEMSADRTVFGRLQGSLAEDPVRVVHAFPRVAAVGDFRSDFAVRGSPFRHVDLVIDGVSTPWLQHTAHNRGETGSLPMLSGLVLDDVTLRTGAYPRRHGDRLGPELDLTLREGSRSDVALRGAIGGTHAMFIGEGPIGAARGSWLVAARQSYLEWPPERSQSRRTSFGFSDGMAKIVLDVQRTQQVALTALGGISAIDGEDEFAGNEPGDGANRASLLNVSWRSTFGTALVIRQRAHLVRQRFVNKDQSEREIDRGANHEVGYRTDLTWATLGGLLDAGAQVARTTVADVSDSPEAAAVTAQSWLRAGYAHFAWTATPALMLSPGIRVTSSSLLRNPTVSWWLLGEWTFRPGWRLTGSAGVSRQAPELRATLSEHGSVELRPERARQFDLGLERRLTSTVRWQATMYVRREADVLRAPDIHPRLVGAALVLPARERYVNALRGTSHGIELLVDRRSSLGLSGWATYSYGRTQQTDAARAEVYAGDFDQRHAFSLFGVFRSSSGASVGTTFRAGSNFPIPGYLTRKDGRLVIASARNQVRLPTYVRLDLRADRRFRYRGRRLTPFVEVENALNRANQGLGRGWVHPVTGEAIGFTDTQLRRRLSAGILVEF